MKKALSIVLVLICFVTLVGCNDEEKKLNRILQYYDLTDPDIYWSGTIEDLDSESGYLLDRVIVSLCKLRNPPAYELFELKHFNFPNAESLRYISLPPAADNIIWNNPTTEWRIVAVIMLKEKGAAKIVEAIEVLQELKFVRRVSLDSIGYPV